MKFGKRPIAVFLVLALCSVASSQFAFGKPVVKSGKGTAELSAYGEVTINGDSSESGTSVFAGSTVATTEDATAVISLADVRIELLPQSSIRLVSLSNNLSFELSSGEARVSTQKGVSATLLTRDGEIETDAANPAKFAVLVSDSTTSFSRFEGALRLKNSGKITELAAGGLFRSGLPHVSASRSATNTRSSSPKTISNVVLLFLSIGTVLAAISGLDPARDASFFSVGGTPSINPSAP